ncbi:MAG: hypothetical protein HXY37_03125 [Chloroflexi bacterium]|nr:hypothetical protein [Chloroflexota bacterium]
MTSNPLSKRERRFVHVFVLTLAICFSPLKAMAFVAPFVFIAGLIFYARISLINHLLKYAMALLSFVGISVIYFLLMPEVDLFNALLFLVTAGSFLVLLYDLRSIATVALLRRISIVALIFVLIESLLGIGQGMIGFLRNGRFDIGSGDIVRGTIDPLATAPPAASNVMFAILLSTLLILLFGTSPARLSPVRLAVLGIGLVAWVLASVMHTLFFFSIATVVSLILMVRLVWTVRWARWRSSGFLALAGILICGGLFAFALLPNNLQLTPYLLRLTFEFGTDSPSEKTRATYNTLFLLPQEAPLQPLIGLGPGQYSSRASLIRSGQYLSGGRLPLPNHVHPLAERYILSEWYSFLINRPNGGSTFFPFYSWLSTYGEFGWMGVAGVVTLILLALRTFRRARSVEFPRLHLAMTILLLYVALLGVQDNYWEIAQAIFPAFLILRVGYSYLGRCRRGAEYLVPEATTGRTTFNQAGLVHMVKS